VLVHGFKGFARFAFFPFLAERLAANGITAVTFNFSGSGVGEDMESFSDPAAFEENTYGSVTFNVMTRVNVGWQDDNYNEASPGAGTLVDHNTIHTYHRGIFHNLQYHRIVWQYVDNPPANFFSPNISGARRLPNARLEIYPDAGHGGAFQYHDAFVTRVLQFLERT
jgi:hypothetical protein